MMEREREREREKEKGRRDQMPTHTQSPAEDLFSFLPFLSLRKIGEFPGPLYGTKNMQNGLWRWGRVCVEALSLLSLEGGIRGGPMPKFAD